MSYRNSNNFSYDKHSEHVDRTSLGKLRSKYWTTKQLVIKKLGREEDEFVIASDADVDAKLELLNAIKRSCNDLIRVCLFALVLPFCDTPKSLILNQIMKIHI